MNDLDLSIIIVNYRERGFLRQCLKGIYAADLKLKFEIIVVDNNSNDGSADMVRQSFPNVVLEARQDNPGLAVATNVGIKRSRGRYLLFMNADIAVFPGVIERLAEFLERHPDVGLIAPKLLNPDRSVQISCYRFPSLVVPILRRTPLGKLPSAKKLLRSYLMLDWDHNATQSVEWVLGACMMVRRSAVEKVGVMDERFFMYFEDVDWCRRFWSAGLKVVYLADTWMIHYHQRMSAESPGLSGVFQKLTRIHIQSAMKYFRKYRQQPLPVITPLHATT
ncbi:MAG: glycosyltransferase family 2 protein [Candidatus Kerfeldbacteria bacterium]|nr:glycosyltransferase family 2 protein [Candidatus Kerfeldbacteria bacterium]